MADTERDRLLALAERFAATARAIQPADDAELPPSARGAPTLEEATRTAIASADVSTLAAMFGQGLVFGTAGLRAPMRAGYTGLNDVTIMQAAQGLVSYILARFGDSAKSRGVVIGFDHRALGRINSARLARITACACLARGVRVYLHHGLVHTPLVPYSVVMAGAVAGVMVTASHNPKEDNGYKVYGDNGAQIIAPVDAAIAAQIAANAEPWPEADYAHASEEVLRASPLCAPVEFTQQALEAYLAAAASQLCANGATNATACTRACVYTAMHGVGTPFAKRMFEAFHLPPFHETPEQCSPDATFPTVAYPNPEEGAGALACAMARAEASHAPIIIANDPDADRFALAEATDAGGWRIFNGNEIGVLLAAWQWSKYVASGGDPARAWMVSSAVSAHMLAHMAKVEGFHWQEVLTGFKYMGNVMAERAAAGDRVIFSYEEAIGFSCGDVVRDKDGVTAAAVCVEMANDVFAKTGRTLTQQLQWLYQRYGNFVTLNSYVFVHDPRITDVIFARLRNDGHYWMRVRDLSFTRIRDLTGKGWDSAAPDGVPTLPTSSGSHMLTYTFSNGVVATLRTSGTEPKLKYYCELRGEDADAARAELQRTVEILVEDMLQPEKHGLKRR